MDFDKIKDVLNCLVDSVITVLKTLGKLKDVFGKKERVDIE